MVAGGKPTDTADVSTFGRHRYFAALAAFGLLIGGVLLADPASAAAPPAPASISIDAVGNSRVDLSWTASEGAGTYRIWTKSGSDTWTSQNTTFDPSASIYLHNDVTYDIGVSAVDGVTAEESVITPAAGTATPSLGGLTVLRGPQVADTRWTMTAD